MIGITVGQIIAYISMLLFGLACLYHSAKYNIKESCIFGTFILSLLVIFLMIDFDVSDAIKNQLNSLSSVWNHKII